ncbi:MAG TPA: hypothetical protein VHB77_14985 [Planctomycetaceae bacterium]|nr:hypothetical protein [Planctomycetaceae bacterium]
MHAAWLLVAIVALSASTAFADDAPAAKGGSILKLVYEHLPAAVKDREAVQMLNAILSGSQMGPGEGWFRPSVSRYGWGWLAERHHVALDGAISAEAFQGDAEAFERLDRNRDGVLKADDFDWSSNSPFVRQMAQAGQWFRGLDASSNGRITREEWDEFFERVAGGKDFVTPEDLRSALFPPPARGAGSQGPSEAVLLKGLLAGELGSFWEGPALNAPAPDFELNTQTGRRSIRLSSFREQKPVVLIFGSFT